ncbi:DUF488 domain-containing protein [Glaciibacter sp. 2TAF33]|uniref:DUF488 domain-containing protein n=1 Tax=Glaciibacter sp. 2TAF33 TaxID=3233015 RepID=UPI003F8FF50B
MVVEIKRVYEPAVPGDGCRILVDRIWPRGISRTNAHVEEWLKDVAPSTELRTRFGHIPDRFDDFADRYRAELQEKPATVDALAHLRERVAENNASNTPTTLVYSAKDTRHNQARVLADYLNDTANTPR